MGYITTGQAAERTGTSNNTIIRAIKAGKLAAITTPGGHYRVDEQEIDKLAGEPKHDC